jgi:hypothetical protein
VLNKHDAWKEVRGGKGADEAPGGHNSTVMLHFRVRHTKQKHKAVPAVLLFITLLLGGSNPYQVSWEKRNHKSFWYFI